MTGIRRAIERACAYAIRDKRSYQPYSWGWLNNVVDSLIWNHEGAGRRPHFAWGAVMAAAQGRAFGLPAVRLVEFGVAGGRGLMSLQSIAAEVTRITGVRLEVVGFDTGQGLPAPVDARDLPNLYGGGDYQMDVAALRRQLDPAITTLHLGPIRETVSRLDDGGAPVGFISLDVDLYSSSIDAMTMLTGARVAATCLPRPIIYLDDSMGLTFGDLTGERLAVAEYNAAHHPTRGIFPVYGLRYYLPWPHSRALWPEMLYWVHLLDHPLNGRTDGLIPHSHAPLGS
jgi:hypothetical protein